MVGRLADGTNGSAGAERRSVHLGLDVWTPAEAPVCAPLAGTVAMLRNNDVRLDYGPVVILVHQTDDGVRFWSLYGHLSLPSLDLTRSAGRSRPASRSAGWGRRRPTVTGRRASMCS